MSDMGWLRTAAIVGAILGGLVLIGVAFSAGDAVEGQSWSVSRIATDGELGPPLGGTIITATFENDAVGGIAGCNTYFGSYQVEGSRVAFDQLGSTLMFCNEPQGVMDQESAYLGLLQSATKFVVEKGQLKLIADDVVVVVYDRVEPALLDD